MRPRGKPAPRGRRPAPLRAAIGVIGGSGLYEIPGAKLLGTVRPKTPWGLPSDAISVVEVAGHAVAFLPRHGKGHRILPTEVNSRANLCALKSIGVEQVVAFSAVGSLKEELKPLDFVVPHQLIDRTRQRARHVLRRRHRRTRRLRRSVLPAPRELAAETIRAQQLPGEADRGDTLVCMEGPLLLDARREPAPPRDRAPASSTCRRCRRRSSRAKRSSATP